MRSLSETQFWFVAASVALTPMFIFGIADGIGWFLRRTLWPCPETEPQSGREPASNEVAGVSISWDAAAMSVTEKEASRLAKLDRIGGLGDPGAQQQE